MLKLVLIGVWIAVVTAGSAFLAGGFLSAPSAALSDAQEEDKGIEHLKTEITSVPMVRGGEVLGYVIIQLSFAADRSKLEALKLEPEPFLIDAAFRAIYSNTQVDFRRLRASDLDRLTSEIASLANLRIGDRLVRQVLIQQMNYVRKEDIRTNWIGDGSQGGGEH